MSIECPIECVRAACPSPDFLEKHSAWLLTVMAAFTGCIGVMLTYFLKSRCRKINCCGVSCVRDVMELDAKSANLTSAK